MSPLSRDIQLALVAEAGRAPSAHNTQPARWRFTADGAALLFEDTGRRLAVGDPTGRDHLVGLGAAFEGLKLALSRRGLTLGVPETAPPTVLRDAIVPERPELRLVAHAVIRPSAAPDPLAAYVTRRRTYRGRFFPPPATTLAVLRAVLDHAPDIVPIYDPETIAALARRSDRASFGLLTHGPYQSELYRWIRFSPKEAAWARDGLTADCLGLSAPGRLAARWLLEPRCFAWLARMGLHRPLVAEAHRTRSATALAILHHPREESGLVAGQRFYRLWLEITRAGCDARPVSALVDDREADAQLRELCRVPETAALVNVFAIGGAAAAWRAVSPRLPPEELLV